MKRLIFSILFALTAGILPGQTQHTLVWRLNSLPDSLSLEKFEFYCFENSEDGSKVHHLVKIQSDKPCSLLLNNSNLYFGVDSALQVLGIQGGVLDPMNNLYWTWQSGYIHLKIEFSSKKTKKLYQFHIGGYKHPFNTIMAFPSLPKKNATAIIDFSDLLKFIQQKQITSIMSPNDLAVHFSKLFCASLQFIENEPD